MSGQLNPLEIFAEPSGPGTIRITFPAVPGNTYEVEETQDLEGPWALRTTIFADQSEEQFEVAFGGGSGAGLYLRVILQTQSGEVQISPIVAFYEESTLGPMAAFQVIAQSPETVQEVLFYSDGLLRGLATAESSNAWVYRELYDPTTPQTIELSATARDTAGNTASTELARFLLADPARFVPLDAAGDPNPGSFVPLRADGSLGAFEFRPDGRAPVLSRTGVRFRFAPGARLELIEGRQRLSAGAVEFERGWHDPSSILLSPVDGISIPVDHLDASDLKPLLGMAPSDPVTLHLLPGRPILWHEGAINDRGLEDAATSPAFDELANIPLPGRPEKSELAEDPLTGEPIYRAIYHGDFTLPGSIRLTIPRQAPWTFVFRQDGSVALSGEARVELANGATFRGSVSYSMDRVCFSLSAQKVTADALGSLLELLPEDPSDCVPGSPEDQAMNIAAACLEAYRNAYQNFAAGAVQVDEVDFERDLVPLSNPVQTGAAALEAWAWRLVALESENPTGFFSNELVDQLAVLTENAADAARAQYTLPGLLAWQKSLERFRLALEAAQAAGHSGNVAALELQLDNATATLLIALERRLRETEPDDLVPLLGDTLQLLLQIEEINQRFESPSTEIVDLGGQVADVVGRRFLIQLGLGSSGSGTLDPDLDRFSTAKALRQTLQLWQLLSLIGRDDLVDDLALFQAIETLTTHLASIHETDVEDALARKSFNLAFIVMRQRLELMAQIALLGLEEDFPQFSDPAGLLGQWDELAAELLNNPSQEWRRDGLLEALRYVRKTLAYVPERAASYSDALRGDLYRLLEEFYQTGRFNTALGPRDWLEWLEGGVLHDHLGRRYSVTRFFEPYSEAQPLSRLQILVEGLVEASGGQAPGEGESQPEPQFAFLDQAASLLLAEIQAIRVEVADASLSADERDNRRTMRLAYLEALGRLLQGYQTVATRLYTEAAARPGSLAFFQDMLLPGDIRIHKIAGAACFNPNTGAFAGRFSGDVELPKFDTRLTVPNASFDTAGNVSLSAHGQAAFPGEPTPAANRVSLRVPSRRPLSIEVRSSGDFAVSGGASLTLPGGHTLMGFLSIDDPDYVFELAYGGALRLDLLEEVTLVRPTLDLDPSSPLDLGVSAALAGFYGSVATSFESFIEDAPAFPSAAELDPGAAPDFQNPVLTVPTDALDAWVTSLANEDVISRLNGSYAEAASTLRALFSSIDEEFAAARAEIAPTVLQLNRLRQRLALMAEAREGLNQATETTLLSEGDIDDLLQRSRDITEKSLETANTYLVNVPDDAPTPLVLAALELNLESVAEAQAIGIDTEFDQILYATRLRDAGTVLLAEVGLAPDGTVLDEALLEATSDRRLMALGLAFLKLSSNAQALGIESFPLENPVAFAERSEQMLSLVRARKLLAYQRASDAGDLENRVLNAVWLMRFNTLTALGSLPASDAIETGFDAFKDTFEAIAANRGGDPATARKLALDFTEAAADNVAVEREAIEKEREAILGESRETRVRLNPLPGRAFGQYSLWELLSTNFELLVDRGTFEAIGASVLQGDLSTALAGYLAAFQAENQIDVTFAQQNFNALYTSLLAASDIIAFIEAYLPEDGPLLADWQATWQPLSIEFLGVAEARRAWWYLETYTVHLANAAVRYGDGLSGPAADAFATVGREGLAGLASVVDAMEDTFGALDFAAFDFPLPGDLTVERLYGRLAFNRLSLDWAVAFGGAVRFPDINLFFALDRASLNSDGLFDLRLRTSGPVPFGFDNTLRLDVANAFSLSGNLFTPSIANASASGTLTRQPEGGGGLESYSISLSYSFTPPGAHAFTFNAAFTDDVEVFTEDLMIFRGGFSFGLALDADGVPTQTAFSASSQVGMLARTSPLPADPSPEDFKLLFEGTASLNVTADATEIILGPGTLELPTEFEARSCGLPGAPIGGVNRPSVSIPATSPLTFTYSADPSGTTPGTLAMAGRVDFANLRFALPGIDELYVDVCALALEFGFDSAEGLPTAVLKDLNGEVSVPFPGEESARAALEVQDWSLDRLPREAAFYLADDLTLLEQGGFSLVARGGRDGLGIPRSGFALATHESSGRPVFVLTGAFQSKATDWFQNQAGDPVTLEGEVAGILVVETPEEGSPLTLDHFEFDLPLVQFGAEGELFFGGEAGLGVVDPQLTLRNPLQALQPSPEQPFSIGLDLGIRIATGAAYDFTVKAEQMELTFDGSSEAPLVSLGGFGGCLEQADINGGEPVSITGDLPFNLRRFCLQLKNLTGDSPVPLFPADPSDLPAFSVQNLEILLSADLALPPGAPIVNGSVNDLVVGFSENNLPTLSIDGIGLGVDLTEYLGEEIPLGGTVFIGGFQTGNYYFSGRLGANIKGNLVDALVAFDSTGLRGVCFGLSGSEINVPLGYGFVLTGARGGLALGDGLVDPCDFVGLMNINPATGKPSPTGPGEVPEGEDPFAGCPLVTWEELQALKEGSLDREAIALDMARAETVERLVVEDGLSSAEAAEVVDGASADDLADLNAQLNSNHADSICPEPGTCPPASLGILAQPHPESFLEGSPYEGRTIFKFTSIDETTLNFWGLDRDLVDSLVPAIEFDRDRLAARFGEEIRLRIETLVPRPPSDLPQPLPAWADGFEAELAGFLDELELGFFNTFLCAFETIGAPANRGELVDQLYQEILDAAYAGIPYTDVTYRLEGSFSYTGIASFASITGGVMLSTSGTVGVNGFVNIFGVPVGYARVFLNQTDAYGNPSAALCGEVDLALGPLELGNLGLRYDCPGCETRLLDAFLDLGSALTAPYVYALMESIDPERADPALSPAEHFALLDTPDKQYAFLAAFVDTPPTTGSGVPNEAFRSFMVALADAIAPRLAACAGVQPRLFGFPLSGDNVSLGAKFYAGPVDPDNIAAGQQLFTEFAFSPIQLFAAATLQSAGGYLVPALDQAEAATYFEVDSVGTLLDEAFVLTPDTYLNRRVSQFFDTSITTYRYELSPFGLTLGKAAGRIVFPSWEHHPRGANPRVPPADRGQGLPTERDVLFATLAGNQGDNRLADPRWRGTPDDLAELFAGTGFENPVNQAQLDLVDDYFPHGGFLGAAELYLPKLLTEGLPASYYTMLDADNSLFDRFNALQEFIAEVSASELAGSLSFYIPAPNPPSLLASGFPASPQDLFTDFASYDPTADFADLYPIEELFMRGAIDLNLLGMPVAEADLELVPEQSLYSLTARIPAESWLARMLGEARFEARIRQGVQASEPMDAVFAEWAREVAAAARRGNARQQDALLRNVFDELAQRMPRVNVNTNLAGFTIPLPGYDPRIGLNPSLVGLELGPVAFAAYSPQFDPEHPGETPFDAIRREGGIGVSGSFAFNRAGLEIASASATLTLRPDASALQLPLVEGQFEADSLGIDGVSLSPAQSVTGTFSSSPTRLALGLEAEFASLPFLLFDLEPLEGQSRIPLRAELMADVAGFASGASLEVGPARFQLPSFSEETYAILHGATVKDPASLSTTGTWNATGTLTEPGFELIGAGTVIARLTGTGAGDLSVALSGEGLVVDTFEIANLPSGWVVETYPNLPDSDIRRQTFTIGPVVSGSLRLAREGDFELQVVGGSALPTEALEGITLQSGYVFTLTEDSFELESRIPSLGIPAFGILYPRSSDGDNRLTLTAEGTVRGSLAFTLEPARFETAAPLVQTTAFVDGGIDEKGTILPISFTTNGIWSARIVFASLSLDLDGPGSLPAVLSAQASLTPRGVRPNLFSAELIGNGLKSLGFSASYDSLIDLTMLDNTPFERVYTELQAGNVSFSLNTSGAFEFLIKNFPPGSFNLGSIPSGASSVPILSVSGSGSSSLLVSNDRLELDLTGPTVSLAGENLNTGNPGTFRAEFTDTADFSASFTSSSSVNFFGPMLQLRSGTHTLSGKWTDLSSTLQLDAGARVRLVVPDLKDNTLGTTTITHNFDLVLNAGESFQHTWNPGDGTGFDLGWLRVSAGSSGRVHIARDTFDFSVDVEDWDVFLFGTAFNNQLDVGFSSAGGGSLTLGDATFNFAEGAQYWIQLVTNVGIPFTWNAVQGVTTVRFPTQTDLRLPGAGLLQGTFLSGLDIPNNFPTLSSDGTFDHTFSRTVNLNGASFSSVDVRFYRSAPNGNVRLLIDHQLGGDFIGADLDVYLSTGGAFRMRLEGSMNVPVNLFSWAGTWATLANRNGDLRLASIDLDLGKSVLTQFEGTATVAGNSLSVVIGTNDAYVAPDSAWIGWLRFPLPTF